MPSEKFFSKPFDDSTKCKLEIYHSYLREWLPVFLASPKPHWTNINIFDFFAGQGQDSEGYPGSPLITISEVNKSTGYIVNHKMKVRLYFNEFDKEVFENLKQNAEKVIKPNVYTTQFSKEDFQQCFWEQYPLMENAANFIFLDQKGIKQITEEVFLRIVELKQTDFLFFISSSFIHRFGESEEFQRYLKIRQEDIQGKEYFHIHRLVLDYYRSLIPKGKQYFLAPFSIKKGSNVYGLIFGTNHTYGLEKFLKVCWKIDQQRGEANFDIDREKINFAAPTLFEEYNKPTKRQLFEGELKSKILNKVLKTSYEVYLFTLESGFLLKDANDVLRELSKGSRIEFTFNLSSGKLHTVLPGNIKVN
ncbi:MAG: three-Cys-motif partner protein TcmP [Saprospiraceae bacterium]|nr:three-Cys-motif partner protein TcmP [Saprospiraceae bacterium]